MSSATLQWSHNGGDSVSNNQPHDCLLKSLFRRRLKKHQSSASLVFVRWIHRWPVNSPHKWPVRREMFPFVDAIMELMGSAQVIIFSGSGSWVRSTKHLCQSSRSHGNYVHLTTCNEIRSLKWSGHHCRIHFMYIRKIANTYKIKRLISDLYS